MEEMKLKKSRPHACHMSWNINISLFHENIENKFMSLPSSPYITGTSHSGPRTVLRAGRASTPRQLPGQAPKPKAKAKAKGKAKAKSAAKAKPRSAKAVDEAEEEESGAAPPKRRRRKGKAE